MGNKKQVITTLVERKSRMVFLIKNNSRHSQETKQLFKKHLENKDMINHKQSMLYTSAYLEFKATLNASKVEEIPVLANDYIQLLNPKIQEPSFNGFTDFTKGINR